MEFDTPEYWECERRKEYEREQQREHQQQMEEHYGFCSQVVQDYIDGNLTREEAEVEFARHDEDPSNLDEWVANTTASDKPAPDYRNARGCLKSLFEDDPRPSEQIIRDYRDGKSASDGGEE